MSQLKFSKRPKYPKMALREIALLEWSPSDFTDRLGVPFETGIDDLDSFQFASVRVDGEPFFLIRYDNSPNSGTELLARSEVNPQAALDRFLSATGDGPPAVAWVTDWVPASNPVIVEPANPFDISKERLRDLRNRLAGQLSAAFTPQLALRSEVGFGVTGYQALRVWMPTDAGPEDVQLVVDSVVPWLRDLWEEDLQKPEDRPRTRSVSVLASDGHLLRDIAVRAEDGRIVDLEPKAGTRSPFKRPTVNDNDEEAG